MRAVSAAYADDVIVDTHAHVYPAAHLDDLEKCGIPHDDTAIARGLQADDTAEDMAARIAMMDAAGVDVQVLSATPQMPALENEADAVRLCRDLNDRYARLAREYPGRFLCYAALPIPHADASVAELRRCLDELGFVGAAVPAFLGADGSIADGALDAVYAELDARGSILYIHPAGHAAGSAAMRDHGLTWVNAAPMEDAIATLQLMKHDVPARFPGMRIHVAHLGGDLPFLAQRIQDNYDDWGAFEHSPRETLRAIWFDAANFFGPSLRLALEVYDPAKVLAGSDYPYFRDDKYTRAFTYIRDAGLAPGQADAILSDNPAALYGDALAAVAGGGR